VGALRGAAIHRGGCPLASTPVMKTFWRRRLHAGQRRHSYSKPELSLDSVQEGRAVVDVELVDDDVAIIPAHNTMATRTVPPWYSVGLQGEIPTVQALE
jgi:hypothetical protein